MEEPPRIMIVEDEYLTSTDMKNGLTEIGYSVPGIADTGPDAIRLAGELKPDLILMDITLKGSMNGIEAARQIRERFSIPVVFVTAHTDDVTVESAVASEPFGYLVKPLDERAMKTMIRMALSKHAVDQKLRHSELMIRGLMNATRDETVLVDRDGRILDFNEAFGRAAGRPAGELKNTPVFELIGSGISMKTAEELQGGNLASLRTFEEESGGRWLDTTIYPISDAASGDRHYAIYRHDITALKKADNDLRAANEQLVREKSRLALYAAALDDMSDYAIITDGTGTITCVNRSFEKKFAVTRGAMKGKHFSELAHADNPYPVSPSDFLQFRDADNIALFIAKNAYGIRMPMTLKSRPFSLVNNRPGNFVFVLRDKTG